MSEQPVSTADTLRQMIVSIASGAEISDKDMVMADLSRAANELDRLREKVAILEAELRVVYKMPGEIDRLMKQQ